MINRPLRSGAPVWFLLLAHWAVTSAGPPPDDEVHGWLQRMSRAVRVLSYDGVFVYTQNEQLDVLRVVHYVDDRGETERITTLTGQPREVIRDKEQVTCILPEDRKVSVGIKANRSPFPKLFAERIAKLSGTYDFKMGGTDRVAGRSVRQLVITPKDGYRYDQNEPEAFSGQDYFPEALGRQTFYNPPDRGFEHEIRKRLAHWAKLRRERGGG